MNDSLGLRPLILYLLFQIISILGPTNKSFAARDEHTLWGTYISIETQKASDVSRYLKKFLDIAQQWQAVLDPDCYYIQKDCTPGKKLPKELEGLVKKLSIETLGYFNILSNPHDPASAREFAGLSEGFLLEEFRKAVENEASLPTQNLVVDFGKDFLILGPKKRSILWGDPILQVLPLAEFKIQKGFLLGASERKTGSFMRNPKVKNSKNWKEDFSTITLLAKPSFSGSRLKAWATALIPGGKPLLAHLLSLREFRGMWSYAYIDKKSKQLICSPDLLCLANGKRSLYTIETRYSF